MGETTIQAGSAVAEIERLRQVLRLEDGRLFWQVNRKRHLIGSEAGAWQGTGYRQVMVDGRRYLAHRIVFAIVHGRWPVKQIDHINGITSDNRPENLREATVQENSHNTKAHSDGTSGIKGVCWSKAAGKWKVRIMISGKNRFLGYFDDLELAAAAYASAAEKSQGKFAANR